MRLKTVSTCDGVITLDVRGETSDPFYVILWTAPGGITVLARQSRSRSVADATLKAMATISKRSSRYQPDTAN